VSNCRGVTPKKVDDKNQALAGASFSLFTDKAPLGGAAPDNNDTLYGTCGPTTLPTGTCTIPNVKGGSYWLVETTTPNGYATAAPQLITVPAGAGPDVTATFVDNPVPGSIDLTKVDAQTQAALQGAQFGLFTDASPFGTAPGAGDGTTAIDTCTTTAAGLCAFSNVAVGHYWVEETLTPNGYDTVAPIAANVPLGTAANTGSTVHLGTVGDNEHPGSLRVIKTDGVNGDLLDGAVFELVHDSVPTGGNAPGAEDTSQVGTCTTGATGDKGACTFGTLALGQYWVIETTAPVGFGLADPAFTHVTIGLGGAANQGDNQEVSFPDPRLPLSISLVKSVNDNSSTTSANPLVVETGSTLSYKVVITNSGAVDLTISSLNDTLHADLPASCTQGNGSTLVVGASFTCTYSSVAAVPSAGGLVVNTASVAGTDQFGRKATAEDTRHVRVLDPAINIVKAGPNGTHVGETVTYTLTVTNPGNTGLSDVVVSDPKCNTAPALVGKSGGNQDAVLDTNETWTYTCDHLVVSADGTQIVNTATADGVDPLGRIVTSKSSHTTPVLHPAIAISKSANPTSANPGQTVVYTYTVTNPGDATLTTVGVSDDKCSPVTFVGGDTNGDTQLNVDETWTFTCSNTASSTGGDNTNVGTTSGIDRLGKTVTASASATITVVLAEVIARQLPFTGSKTGRFLTVAVLLMLAGLFFFLGGARIPSRKEQ
jgi:uncharacterized repeat protein (TIGR01451 family)